MFLICSSHIIVMVSCVFDYPYALLLKPLLWHVISWCDLGWFGTYGKGSSFQIWRNPRDTRVEPLWGFRGFRQAKVNFAYKYQTIC